MIKKKEESTKKNELFRRRATLASADGRTRCSGNVGRRSCSAASAVARTDPYAAERSRPQIRNYRSSLSAG